MEIIVIIVSLLFAVLFSGAETAFITSSKIRFELDKKQKNLVSFILSRFYKRPGLFLVTLLVGNCIVLVVYSLQMVLVTEPWLASHIPGTFLLLLSESVLSAILAVLAGVFIPRLVSGVNPYFFLSFFSILLYLVYILLLPVSLICFFLSRMILKMTGLRSYLSFKEKSLGRVDLDRFIQNTIEQSPENAALETEVKIFQNALDFSSIRLKDCMVPRTEIVAFDLDVNKQELLSRFIETGLSKILIYNENIDDIAGCIHSTEMFVNPDDWKSNIKPVPIVPETMAANKLMKVLMQEKKTIAVVVDEFGGTSGIVCMEDLVEEIFGDFEDEHDTTTYVAKKNSETEFVLSGRMEIDKVNEMFELDLPESEDYQTIAGLILHAYQKFPQLNEVVVIGRFSFSIIKKTATKIELVKMKILK